MESDKQPASFDVDEFSAVKENLENLEPDSEHRRAVQVEMIVHSKQRRLFRRGTLQGWLGESVHPEVEHLEAEPIHPGRNKPFTSHETIKKFYTETTREEPLNGKRHLEIYLASGEDVVGKAGRPKGTTKAVSEPPTRASGGGAMAALPGAAAAHLPELPLPRSLATARQEGGGTVPVGVDRASARRRRAQARQTMAGRMSVGRGHGAGPFFCQKCPGKEFISGFIYECMENHEFIYEFMKKAYDFGCTKKCPVKEFLYMNLYMNSYSHM